MRFFVLLTLCACGARTDLGGSKSSSSSSDSGIAETSTGCHDEIIAADSNGAGPLAIDGDDVFWGTQDGFVRAKHAGVIQTLASMATSIDSIAVDATNVYFTITGSVMFVARAGGPVGTMKANAGQPFAITPAAGDFFWIDYGAGIAAGSILRNGNPILTMLDTPRGLAVANESVFSTSELAIVNQQSVMAPLIRAKRDGSDLVVLRQGLHQPGSIAAFGGRVYFIEQVDATSTLHGGVRSIDENGGATQVEIQTDGFLPIDLAVDGSGAYATAYSQAESDLFHGSTVIAKTAGVFYEAVRTNATAIYWTIAWTGAPPPDGASVRKLCK